LVRGGAPRSARLVTVQYKAELVAFDKDAAGLPVKAPIVRPMNAGDLEEHRARRPPKPDVAAENATDGAAIAKLERDAPDVLKALQKITKPNSCRPFATGLTEVVPCGRSPRSGVRVAAENEAEARAALSNASVEGSGTHRRPARYPI
jgi:hypothetical protein